MTDERNTAPAAEIVDARGFLCPLPIVRTARALTRRPGGTVVELLADDPGIVDDLPAWCRTMGHELLEMAERGGVWHCHVRKGADAAAGTPPAPGD